MINYVCDRCGDIVVSHERFEEPGGREYTRLTIRISHTNKKYDFCLCDKCAKEILLQVGVKLEEDNE